MEITSVTALFSDLPVQELTIWVERGWVQPETTASGWMFHEVDVARVRLIHDLRRGMDIGEEAVPLILSLLDQVYELRCQLKGVLRALETQPAEVRQAIQAAL
jgi:chaperone modulatory protein CbpM